MYTSLITLHLFTAFVMIAAILLQAGKGAEIGATFGGSSQTIFGGRGATTFLAKFTAACAILFMVTSLSLAFLSKERSIGTSLTFPEPPPVAETSEATTEPMDGPATEATAGPGSESGDASPAETATGP